MALGHWHLKGLGNRNVLVLPGLEDIEVNHEALRGTRKIDTLRVWVVLEEGREQSD